MIVGLSNCVVIDLFYIERRLILKVVIYLSRVEISWRGFGKWLTFG